MASKIMTAAATVATSATSAASSTSGLGRTLMKEVQTKTRLPKTAQDSSRYLYIAKKPLKMVPN